MSVFSQSFSFQNSDRYYAKWARFVKQYVDPSDLDSIERPTIHILFSLPMFLFIGMARGLEYMEATLSPRRGPLITKIVGCAVILLGVTGLLAPMLSKKINRYVNHFIWRMDKTLMKSKFNFIDHRIAEIAKNSQNSQKPQSMCVIRIPSRTDWNGAFSTHQECANFEQFAKTHSIDLISEETSSAILAKMKPLTKKYDVFLIQGHGRTIRFFGPPDSSKKDTTVTPELIRCFTQHVKNRGIVILHACNAGKGENNIAKRISLACPNATIYATTKQPGRVTFQKESLIPSFWHRKNERDVTCIYQNGKLISSKS